MAHVSPEVPSTARHTVPNAPFPTAFCTTYRPSAQDVPDFWPTSPAISIPSWAHRRGQSRATPHLALGSILSAKERNAYSMIYDGLQLPTS